MISVIIPTMLTDGIQEQLSYTLNQMQNTDVVDEILIINNNPNLDFFDFLDIERDKIKIIYHGENLFVNPSWNLGISEAKNEVYCILNDDVISHSANFVKCYYKVLEPNIGLITTGTALHHPLDAYVKSHLHEENKGEFTEDIPNGRQGWFFFGKKENWIDIPSELKIFYGDDYLFLYHTKSGLQNLILKNGFVSHNESATSKNYFDVNAEERPFYLNLIKEFDL